MKRNKIIVAIAFLIVFFTILAFFSYSLKNAMFAETDGTSRFLSTIGNSIEKHFHFWFYLSDLQKENNALSEKISSLEVDRSKIEELQYENNLLKKELGFAEANPSQQVIPARIIGREPASYLDYIIVDKGKLDGVKEGGAVVSNGTLIGQAKEVYDHSAKVILITSKDSNVLVMLQESRAKGILRGGIAGLVLEDIIQDVEFKPGEYVITSGLDGKIPEGILVGKTDQLKSSPSDLFKKVSVEPIEDLSNLEIVFILK